MPFLRDGYFFCREGGLWGIYFVKRTLPHHCFHGNFRGLAIFNKNGFIFFAKKVEYYKFSIELNKIFQVLYGKMIMIVWILVESACV